MPSPSRRDLLKAAPLAAVPWFAGLPAGQGAEPPVASPTFPGLVVRMQEPRNLEFPISALKESITPTEQFFVRSHFAVPKIDRATWKLKIEGDVENPLELSYDDILKLKSVTKPITLECAGNGRVFLTPAARGLQWGFGGVSNGNWTGVEIATVLDKAGVKAGATEVIFVGTDRGAITADPASPGPINFDRSIPLEKVLKPDCFLAYQLNGDDLPPAHGFPLRGIIGGWYGMASIKWLARIIVTSKPHAGFWQTMDYSYFKRRDGGLPTLVPVTAIEPKAVIAQPTLGEVVPFGKPYRIHGAAWAGEKRVREVDISADGGKTWERARCPEQKSPLAWTLWDYEWTPMARGPISLLVRCTDASGNRQPAERDSDRRSSMINHLVPVEVLVK